jgi:hypothetical protein
MPSVWALFGGRFSGVFRGFFRGFCLISVVRSEMAKKPNVYRGFWYTERALISSQIASKGGEWVEGAERG